MTDQTRKVERFRALHIRGKPFVLFNISDTTGEQSSVRLSCIRFR
jgi:hypothetical protein